jgi:hypothetical protein
MGHKFCGWYGAPGAGIISVPRVHGSIRKAYASRRGETERVVGQALALASDMSCMPLYHLVHVKSCREAYSSCCRSASRRNNHLSACHGDVHYVRIHDAVQFSQDRSCCRNGIPAQRSCCVAIWAAGKRVGAEWPKAPRQEHQRKTCRTAQRCALDTWRAL